MTGVDRERFLAYVKSHPSTYKNWALETTGKEDDLFSPYLSAPFQMAKAAGEIPGNVDIAGTWSRLSEHGEATYINVVYMRGYDATDVRDLTRGEIEGRRQAMWAFDALKKYTPGFEKAAIRTFVHLWERGIEKNNRSNQPDGTPRPQPGAVRRRDWHFSRVSRCLRHCHSAHHRTLFPGALWHHGPAESREPAGGRTMRCRRSNLARRHAPDMCCTVTGQAAGVAAALSIKDGVNCSQVNIGRLQKKVAGQGVRIN